MVKDLELDLLILMIYLKTLGLVDLGGRTMGISEEVGMVLNFHLEDLMISFKWMMMMMMMMTSTCMKKNAIRSWIKQMTSITCNCSFTPTNNSGQPLIQLTYRKRKANGGEKYND